MNSTRIKSLLEMLQAEPNDAFVNYALGLEYLNIDSNIALEYFDQAINCDSNYVSAYYQKGILLADATKKEEASIVFQAGIMIAEKIKDYHALSEFKSALANLYIDE